VKILVPIDGSQNSLRALRHVLDKRSWYSQPLEVHLLNVQSPVVSGAVKMFIPPDQLNEFYDEQAQAALAPARALLQESGLAAHVRAGVGDPAATVAAYAKDQGCALIAMGTRGLGSIGNMLLGSVATKVIHLAEVPVLLIK
jgi:nucleotide-binding universal stress UspA family protein